MGNRLIFSLDSSTRRCETPPQEPNCPRCSRRCESFLSEILGRRWIRSIFCASAPTRWLEGLTCKRGDIGCQNLALNIRWTVCLAGYFRASSHFRKEGSISGKSRNCSSLLVTRFDLGVLEGAGPDEEGGEERGVVHVGHDGLAAVVPANR